MNSALQCLSNSSLLREYFASGDYSEDINEENPMGTGGKVGMLDTYDLFRSLPVFLFLFFTYSPRFLFEFLIRNLFLLAKHFFRPPR